MLDPIVTTRSQVWKGGKLYPSSRLIPEEAALALTYNGGTYAVMMGTPKDLCDFAIGFSLNEGIVDSVDEIEDLEIIEAGDGIELRMWIAQAKSDLVSAGRRRTAGPTGCGICDSESIAAAVRLVTSVPEGRGRVYSTTEIMHAMASVAPLQELNGKTRGTHAAAFWSSESMIVALR